MGTVPYIAIREPGVRSVGTGSKNSLSSLEGTNPFRGGGVRVCSLMVKQGPGSLDSGSIPGTLSEISFKFYREFEGTICIGKTTTAL